MKYVRWCINALLARDWDLRLLIDQSSVQEKGLSLPPQEEHLANSMGSIRYIFVLHVFKAVRLTTVASSWSQEQFALLTRNSNKRKLKLGHWTAVVLQTFLPCCFCILSRRDTNFHRVKRSLQAYLSGIQSAVLGPFLRLVWQPRSSRNQPGYHRRPSHTSCWQQNASSGGLKLQQALASVKLQQGQHRRKLDHRRRRCGQQQGQHSQVMTRNVIY